MTTISVVIPAYNCGRFLPHAIASVRQQSLPAAEIIVVDDGSTDDTGKVVAALGSDIRYFRRQNEGPAGARNFGVAQAGGELIAFLDADDEWLDSALERLSCVLTTSPGVALVTGDMCAVDAAGAMTAPSWFAKHGLVDKVRAWNRGPVPNAVAEIVHRNFVATSVVMLRRSVFEAQGGFRTDLRYGEDLELWARIAAAHEVVCLPEVLGRRRSHSTNTTKSLEPMLRDLVRMSQIIRDWGGKTLKRQGLDPDRMVTDAMTDLGYWLSSHDHRREAHTMLWQALCENASWRTGRALILNLLPGTLANGLRRARARLGV